MIPRLAGMVLNVSRAQPEKFLNAFSEYDFYFSMRSQNMTSIYGFSYSWKKFYKTKEKEMYTIKILKYVINPILYGGGHVPPCAPYIKLDNFFLLIMEKWASVTFPNIYLRSCW